jgi:hypothetical protein
MASIFRRVCLAASASLALSSLAPKDRESLSKSLNLLANFALNEYKGRTSFDVILVEKA